MLLGPVQVGCLEAIPQLGLGGPAGHVARAPPALAGVPNRLCGIDQRVELAALECAAGGVAGGAHGQCRRAQQEQALARRQFRRHDRRAGHHGAGDVPGPDHHREIERVPAVGRDQQLDVADLHGDLGVRLDVGDGLGEDVRAFLFQQARHVPLRAGSLVDLTCTLPLLDLADHDAVAHGDRHPVDRGAVAQRERVESLDLLRVGVAIGLCDGDAAHEARHTDVNVGVCQRACTHQVAVVVESLQPAAFGHHHVVGVRRAARPGHQQGEHHHHEPQRRERGRVAVHDDGPEVRSQQGERARLRSCGDALCPAALAKLMQEAITPRGGAIGIHVVPLAQQHVERGLPVMFIVWRRALGLFRGIAHGAFTSVMKPARCSRARASSL